MKSPQPSAAPHFPAAARQATCRDRAWDAAALGTRYCNIVIFSRPGAISWGHSSLWDWVTVPCPVLQRLPRWKGSEHSGPVESSDKTRGFWKLLRLFGFPPPLVRRGVISRLHNVMNYISQSLVNHWLTWYVLNKGNPVQRGNRSSNKLTTWNMHLQLQQKNLLNHAVYYYLHLLAWKMQGSRIYGNTNNMLKCKKLLQLRKLSSKAATSGTVVRSWNLIYESTWHLENINTKRVWKVFCELPDVKYNYSVNIRSTLTNV